MNKSTYFSSLPALLLGGLLCLGPAQTFAVGNLGLFELDGNPQQNGSPPPDDWETLYDDCGIDGTPDGIATSCGASEVFTGIVEDPNDTSIFSGGGSKDDLDLDSWLYKNGSVSQKSDITHAYAAAYLNTLDTGKQDIDDLIIYFGADRLDNEGSTFMGFWFFQDKVTLKPLPTSGNKVAGFNGLHVNGDVLVLANFPQANNAVPLIQVLKWDDTCLKKSNNAPAVGDCAAANLRLIAGESGAGALCNGSDQLACAITNTGPNDGVGSVWPYTSADGDVNVFPYESFFSGGINITQLLKDNGTAFSGCFSSFMAETRSSESIDASLEDFRLNDFQLCSATAVTTIHDGSRTDALPHGVIALNSSTAVVGDTIHDSVTVTGTSLGDPTPPDPSSPPSVTFVLFSNATCTPAVDANADGYPDNGSSDANVLSLSTAALVGGTPNDGIATAESADYVLTLTGAHCYRAFWLPGGTPATTDPNYPVGAISAIEPFNVIQPKLKIVKDVNTCLATDTDDSGSFTMQYKLQAAASYTNAPNGANLKDGGNTGFFGLNPGTYNVNEIAGAKTGGGTTSLAEYVKVFEPAGVCASGTVTLANNDQKTCTITNVRKPHLIVKKEVVGTSLASDTFDLKVKGPTDLNAVTVDSGSVPANTTYVSGDGSAVHTGEVRIRIDTIVNGGLDPADFGDFVVGEGAAGTTDLANYQTSIVCDDEAATSAVFPATTAAADRKVSVNLDAGQVVTCTIRNIKVATAAACPVQ